MDSDRSTGVIQCKYCQCDYAIRPVYHSYTARDDTGIRTMTDGCSGHIACFWDKKTGGVSKRRILFFYKQSPDFHKPGLCHVQKILYL